MSATTMPITEAATAPASTPTPPRGGAVRSLRAVYGWEMRKIMAMARVWIILGVILVGPWVFIILLHGQDRLPTDNLYGRYLKVTGLATPLVILGFAGQWILPLITSLVGGDIFSTEDQNGTLKTILTRSVGRSSIFWGKVLAACTYAILCVVALTASSTLAGVIYIGHQPINSINGNSWTFGHALPLVLASWAMAIPPVLGFTCLAVLLSIATRNSILGVTIPIVIGFFMQLYAFLNGLDTIRHMLLSTPFLAWHGIFDDPAYYQPLERSLMVSGVYAGLSLLVGWLLFSRRDVTGG
jgi:ABC-2 type transport system permease protein